MFSNLLGLLFGAPQAANTAGGYYQNAANDVYNLYGPSATRYFTAEQNNALRPAFQQQEAQLAGNEAAQGITHSGAGINAFGNLGAQQAGALSSADAGLFSQGLGSAAGIYSQMPSAQNDAYQQAIQQGYDALSGIGSLFGLDLGSMGGGTQPSGGSGGTGYYAPGDPSGVSNTLYIP